MTGIDASTTRPLGLALESLKKSIREGTLKAGRIEVVNASAETRAQVEQNYQATVRQMEQMNNDYRTTLSRTAVEGQANAASLPDVASLSQPEAKSMLNGLRQMKFVGDLDDKTVTASNGNAATDSVELYMQWLQERVGVDAYA